MVVINIIMIKNNNNDENNINDKNSINTNINNSIDNDINNNNYYYYFFFYYNYLIPRVVLFGTKRTCKRVNDIIEKMPKNCIIA